MRALAREVAFKKIFESLFNQEDNLDVFFAEANLDADEDRQFTTQIVKLYVDNNQYIEQLVNSNLIGYEPSRIYKIDKAIIYTAVTEMKFYKETPIAVIINEAVELAKKYGTEKSYAFVNGILKTISLVQDE